MSSSYSRPCKFCGTKIQLRKMPGNQWVPFEGYDVVHNCNRTTARRIESPVTSEKKSDLSSPVSNKGKGYEDLDFLKFSLPAAMSQQTPVKPVNNPPHIDLFSVVKPSTNSEQKPSLQKTINNDRSNTLQKPIQAQPSPVLQPTQKTQSDTIKNNLQPDPEFTFKPFIYAILNAVIFGLFIYWCITPSKVVVKTQDVKIVEMEPSKVAVYAGDNIIDKNRQYINIHGKVKNLSKATIDNLQVEITIMRKGTNNIEKKYVPINPIKLKSNEEGNYDLEIEIKNYVSSSVTHAYSNLQSVTIITQK